MLPSGTHKQRNSKYIPLCMYPIGPVSDRLSIGFMIPAMQVFSHTVTISGSQIECSPPRFCGCVSCGVCAYFKALSRTEALLLLLLRYSWFLRRIKQFCVGDCASVTPPRTYTMMMAPWTTSPPTHALLGLLLLASRTFVRLCWACARGCG